MRNFFANLFAKEKWEPKYQAGQQFSALTAELEDLIGRRTMRIEILERDERTSNHYYRVIAFDVPGLTDSKNQPIDWYIHEKNILDPVA